MTQSLSVLEDYLKQQLGEKLESVAIEYGELTIEVLSKDLLSVAHFLHDDEVVASEILMDVCGVDYLGYGESEWDDDSASFSRGVDAKSSAYFAFELAESTPAIDYDGKRFAVVYHLLSISKNHRIRMRAFCDDNEMPMMDSVVDVWNGADWFEREAFDLFGILFNGHPDLRRILTDYGFIGHPFRKDFPLVGHVQMRYDEKTRRVVYEPVSIEPRVLVPRVVRDELSKPVEEND